MALVNPFVVLALCLLTNAIDCVCAAKPIGREMTSVENIDLPTAVKNLEEIEKLSIEVGENATQLQLYFLGILKDIGSSENPIGAVDNNLERIRKTIEIQITTKNIFVLARGGIDAISGPSIDLRTVFRNAAEIEKTSIDVFQSVTVLQNDLLGVSRDLNSSANPIGSVDDNLDILVRITIRIQNLTRIIFELSRGTNFAISGTSIDPDEGVPKSNLIGTLFGINTQKAPNGVLKKVGGGSDGGANTP